MTPMLRRRMVTTTASVLLISCAHAALLQQSVPKMMHVPWCKAPVDYSGANEYVQAHYGVPHYFDRNNAKQQQQQQHTVMESIYDARQGIYNDKTNRLEPATLSSCGFTLLENCPTAVTDWQDMEQIRSIYLQELRNTLIPRVFGGEEVVKDVVFWHPMLREENSIMSRPGSDDVSTPTAPYAAVPHIDTDVGAYETVEDFVNLIEKNRIREEEASRTFFSRKNDIVTALRNGHRFMIVNVWKNVGKEPIRRRSPLAILATRYSSSSSCFPDTEPDVNQSRWYSFPQMETDECLLFKQYDRDVSFMSDMWHCALCSDTGGSNEDDEPPRRSFDLRAFVILQEKVSPHLDRFSDSRTRPLLTLNESACFCDEQAKARRTQ